MLYKKKTWIIASLIGFVVINIAAIQAPLQKERNLKILPKDISDAKLDSIMRSYNIALGVTCDFCHVPGKNIIEGLDFASDANPMKEEARKMMRMTIDINK